MDGFVTRHVVCGESYVQLANPYYGLKIRRLIQTVCRRDGKRHWRLLILRATPLCGCLITTLSQNRFGHWSKMPKARTLPVQDMVQTNSPCGSSPQVIGRLLVATFLIWLPSGRSHRLGFALVSGQCCRVLGFWAALSRFVWLGSQRRPLSMVGTERRCRAGRAVFA